MPESTKAERLGRRDFFRTSSAAVAVSTLNAASSSSEVGRLTDVHGIRVGHFTDVRRPTGCTVILFDQPAVAGVDVRGSAPGTRETDLLNPINSVQIVNAILLSGGSAFGLDAATGVMRYLSEHGQGVHVGSAIVPIVPAAILFDLQIGDSAVHPDAAAGYAACQVASQQIPEGNFGAGAGATVGKLFGNKCAMKSGLGTASVRIGSGGPIVAALVAVNAVGDVLKHGTNTILAGARDENGTSFRNSMAQIISGHAPGAQHGANTTIGIVATNATLTKAEATKVAQMAHDGLARTVNPVHTGYDGDTIFAAATGEIRAAANVSLLGAVAAEAMARAVNRAVLMAVGIPGYPAARDLPDFVL